MRISLNWLKDYVDIDLPVRDLAHLLTMAGLEVEGIEPIAGSLKKVVAAKIIAVEKHPRADRLFICRMDAGSGETQVVCGAPNVRKGAIVPMALPGARLPNGIVVKAGRFRGEKSSGMLLAEDELGLTDDHSGIMILPEGLEPGIDLSDAMNLEDTALDISLTPNRPDCASIIGIAREVAALTGKRLKMPPIAYEETGPPIGDLVGIAIEDVKGCPRYAAGLIRGVKLGPSPFWLRYRLHVSGIRAINNVVDVTNYVLLELGQPLHSFDFDRLKGHLIVVSRAGDGETFSTLDGQTHTLNREHLMIRDGERAVALAGIMGGLNSEIFAGSRNVLIESAFFDPVTIRRGSKALGMSTEASYRFERGIDIGGAERALRRSLMLISDLAGGEVSKGILDNYPAPHEPLVIELRVDRANQFLGTSLSREGISSCLSSLEMTVEEKDEKTLRVAVPTFRVDITREVDLVEEVARLEGYDRIPVTYPIVRPSEKADPPEIALRDQVSEIMAGLGFSEIITYSFISPDSADLLGAEGDSRLRSFVTLQNPLSTEQSVMRTSLIPGLLGTVKENIAHGEADLKLFEWGNIFINRGPGELPSEEPCLAAIMTGLFNPETWHSRARKVDFYDIKGTVEVLLNSLGLKGVSFQGQKPAPGYHPELSCRILVSDSYLGNIGQIDPDVMGRYDIRAESAFLFEIDLSALLEGMGKRSVRFESFSRFPAVFRDLSIIVERETESRRIMEIIEMGGKGLVESISIFGLYEGPGIGQSEKALNFRVCYRSKEGTLDGKQVNRLHETIIKNIIRETGGRLREG